MHEPNLRQSRLPFRLSPRGAAVIVVAGLVAGCQIPLASAASAAPGDPIAGGQTAGDVLFPNQGNSGYDAQHYDIDLTVDVAVSGTANALASTTMREATTTITAATTGAPLSSYSFDFQGSTGNLAASTLNVDSVTVNGVAAEFSRIENTTIPNADTDVHKLIVTPATAVDGIFTTVVKYHGKPVAHTDTDSSSEGWNATTDGATFVNQPIGSMTAFPNNNTPGDKATYTISVDAPSKLTTSATAVAANPGLKDAAVVSNGELISKLPSADGTRTRWVWNETKPMASELSLISIGRYDTYESDITLASGRTLHEWSFIDPAISVQNQQATQATRAQLKSILDFLESKYGPYPGDSVGIVTDVVPAAINYALETQDRPFFPNSASRSTTIHEFAHQWFGDSVAPFLWNDIWLNEGTATYAENQVAFESAGSSTNSNETNYYNAYNASSGTAALWTVPTAGMTKASQLFASQVYTRGSWALEALRTAIGPADFAKVMEQDQLRNKGTSRTTATFIALAEEISGRSLTSFFQPWLYGNTKAPWPSKFNLTLAGPTAPLNEGDTATYTLSSRNTGKVAQTGSIVTVDLTNVLDKATLGSLPANVAVNGNTLTWTVPSTALNATSSVSFTAVPNAGTTGAALTAVARASTLGSTCINCASAVVVGAQPVSPSAVPTITGTPTVRQPLTADTTGWAEGTTFAYQWLVDGTPVAGATNATYAPDGWTIGLPVSVQVTGSNGALSPVTTTSAATAAVLRGTFAAAPIPTIVGTPQFGKALKVDTSGWDAGTYFTYAWAANGTAITAANGGTGPTFTPSVANQLGQAITVAVTGTKFGNTTMVRTSTATAGVIGGEFGSTPTPTIAVTPRALAATPVVTGQWDDGTTLTYQWSVDGIPVTTGGTSATYTPTIAQIGSILSVAVTGAKPGFVTTTKVSEPSVAVAPAAQVLTPIPVISGTAKVDTELTVTPGTWDAGTALALQWFANGEPVDGATGQKYTPAATAAGAAITVTVTSTKPGYVTASTTSVPTDAVSTGDLVSTPVPTITGDAQVGLELTAVPGTWDADAVLGYQWFADGNLIVDASATTYTPTADTVGSAITVSVTGTKAGYTTVVKTSDATAAVVVGTLAATPVPTISGTPKVGVALTVVPGTWDEGTSLAYQWYADGEIIEGAIAPEFTPGPAKANTVITVAVTGMKDGYVTVTKTSDATDVVALADLITTPIPTLIGTAKVGVLLTALPGTWDEDTELTYQWYADGDVITDAVTSEFTPGADYLGAIITVTVTGAKEGHAPVTTTSAPTAAVAPGDLIVTPVPTVTGTVKVGHSVQAAAGTWDADVTLAYQWLRDGSAIKDATAATYAVVPADLGTSLTVVVTGSKTGYTSTPKTSAATTVAAGDLAVTPVPTITGTAKVGQSLKAVAGTWDAGTTLKYQWLRAGKAIDGATTSTYKIAAADNTRILSVVVTGSKAGYTSISTTSAGTKAVAAGTLTATPVPKISGTTKVGQSVKAVAGTWDAGTTLTYKWLRAGKAISGATKSTYAIVAGDYNKSLSVVVTGSKSGYTSVSKTSAAKTVGIGVQTHKPKPVITGTAKVGNTLSVKSATYDKGAKLSYTWYANGKKVGSNKNSLKLENSMKGKTITVQVTAKLTGYTTVVATSAKSSTIK